MTARVRKLVGGLGLLVFLAGYVWAATALSDQLPDNGLVKFAFFAVVGVAWGVPVLPLIGWWPAMILGAAAAWVVGIGLPYLASAVARARSKP